MIAHSAFAPHDYPEDDAEIAGYIFYIFANIHEKQDIDVRWRIGHYPWTHCSGTICDPLLEAEHDDGSLERDEHNDKIVLKGKSYFGSHHDSPEYGNLQIAAGDEKLVIDNGNLVLEGRPEKVAKDEGVSPDQYKKVSGIEYRRFIADLSGTRRFQEGASHRQHRSGWEKRNGLWFVHAV